MAQLELLGIAKEVDDIWVPRNEMITRILESLERRELRRNANQQKSTNLQDSKYNVNIQRADNVSIGDFLDEQPPPDSE
jgi:hypothetical protein